MRRKTNITAICTHMGRIFPTSTWSMSAHVHPKHFQLIVVLAGQIETRIAGRIIHGRAGDVLLYPRNVVHAERTIGRGPFESIFMNWEETGIDSSDWPLVVHDSHGRIQTLARWMYECKASGYQQNSPLLDLLLCTVLHAFSAATVNVEDEMIARVKQYVSDNIARRISLDHLAEVACLSRFHFARRFRKLAGMAPMRYVRELRVDSARTLLLSSDLPLRTIADRVGFADHCQLSRVFRIQTGRCPSALRKGTDGGRG